MAEEIPKEPPNDGGAGDDATDEGDSPSQSRHVKGILRSLSKPSYTLSRGGGGAGSVKIRAQNRARLRRILSRLVRRRNWEEAAGVLSVLLKGTGKERSPVTNRTKYWSAMELLKHLEGNSPSSTRIQHLYEIWMKKIGTLKNWPIKDRFVVQSEFILFCLGQGNVEDAHQASLCLMQEREFSRDPISNMVVGLTFGGLWFSIIPEELRVSDEPNSPMPSTESGMSYDDSDEKSEGHDAVNIYENGNNHYFSADSDTSVRIDKDIAGNINIDENREISMDVDDDPEKEITNQRQSKSLSMDSAGQSEEDNSSPSNHVDNTLYTSTFNGHAEGFEAWLMPLQLSSNENLENFMYSHRGILNDYYKQAIKHLRAALYSSPPVYEALIPLVQMLLLGNHIDESLSELEKFGDSSGTVLPLRAKASLLEHINRANYYKLSVCFEEILRKDPTCSHSLAKLISLHQRGEYNTQQLLDMIAFYLDATYGDSNTWKEFASCFLKLYSCEEDRMSVCLDGNNEGEKRHGFSVSFNRVPEILTKGSSGKSWNLRCRWWLTRHFSPTILSSEIKAGDSQLLANKAAAASHMYGQEFQYVVNAYAFLKDKYRDSFLFLQMHIQNSVGFYSCSGRR